MVKRTAHYTVRIGDDICMYIALGNTLEKALEKVGYLAPSITQVWTWLNLHEDFRNKYDRARTLQADILSDKTLDYLHDILKNPKDAAAYRLAIDLLKWHAEIRNPKVYNKTMGNEGKAPPLDAAKIKAEIKRLEKELGVKESQRAAKVVSIVKKET